MLTHSHVSMLISQSLEMETSMCKMTSHCRVLARSDADASGAKMHHAHMTLHPSCPITSCNHLCESNLHQSTLSAPFFNAKLYAARALPDFCRYANINSNSKWMQMEVWWRLSQSFLPSTSTQSMNCHHCHPPCHLLDLDVGLGCPFASWPLAAPFVQLWTCQCRACCYFWSFASQAGIEEMDNTMMKASY